MLRIDAVPTDLTRALAPELALWLATIDPWRRLGIGPEPLANAIGARPLRLAREPDGSGEGTVAGLISWVPDAPMGAYLSVVATHPDHRGRGIGTALMDAVEAEAFVHRRFVLLSVSSFNTHAHAFYLRRGFVEIGHLPDQIQDGSDEILLRKRRP